jgi:hypothetical protein
VLAPTERRIEGILTQRSRRIDPRDAEVVLGIPTTTVARMLVDLTTVLNVDALARAIHEAAVRHGTTPHEIELVLERRPKTPGAASLRRTLRGDTHLTLSALERRFLAVLKEHRLPLP